MSTKDFKQTIDSLSFDELREEVIKGSSSRFQGEKKDYLVARFMKLKDEKRDAADKEHTEIQAQHLKAAQ